MSSTALPFERRDETSIVPSPPAPPAPPAPVAAIESPPMFADDAVVHGPTVSPLRRWKSPVRAGLRGWLVAVVIAALYFAMHACYVAPAHPGVDQNGYLVGGKQFSLYGSTGFKPPHPLEFVGRMWVRTDDGPDGVYYPKYPIGLPAIYAATRWVSGSLGVDPHWLAFWVSPFMASLCLLGTFAVARRLGGDFVGWCAMLLVGFGQVMLALADNPNSHATAVGLVACGVAMLLAFAERSRLLVGIAGAFLLGMAYTVRYTDGLMVLVLATVMIRVARWQVPGFGRAIGTAAAALSLLGVAWLAAHPWREFLLRSIPAAAPFAEEDGKVFFELAAAAFALTIASMFVWLPSLWRLALVALGWVVPVAYLTIFNLVTMRSFTSYAGTNESVGFSADFFFANWELMVRTLHDQAAFFVLPFGFVGWLWMIGRRPWMALVLGLWFWPSVLLYTAYYWAPDTPGVGYARFVVTQMPALAIAAAWGIGRMCGIDPTLAPTVAASRGEAVAPVLVVARRAELPPPPSADANALAYLPPRAEVARPAGLASRAATASARKVNDWRRQLPSRAVAGGIVAMACGVPAYQLTGIVETGSRFSQRPNIETISRENNNLAGLGAAIRDAVRRDRKGKPIPAFDRDGKPIAGQSPAEIEAKTILFAEGDRLNYLQWAGDYQLFAANAFTAEMGRRFGERRESVDTDPDPSDPATNSFMRKQYAGKDDKALVADCQQLIRDALASGKRVFYALPAGAQSDAFEKRFVRGAFATRRAGTWRDEPPPRPDEEFLDDKDKPKLPQARNRTRWNAGVLRPLLDKPPVSIVEIVPLKK